MANGHVEIHDPLSNNNLTSSKHPEPTSDSDSMEGTMELNLLRAYAKRRRPKKDESPTQDSPMVEQNGDVLIERPPSPATTKEEVKRKKKKISFESLAKFFSCVKPQMDDEELPRTILKNPDVQNRSGPTVCSSDEKKPEDKWEEVASRLTEIADDIPFTPPELEEDAGTEEDAVEKLIGLLLRDAGDRLYEQELKDASIATELFWNYSFFKDLITRLLMKMGLMTSEPDILGPQASPKTQIAVTCEVASRLSAVNTLPMSRMLDHGARYLQDHYSSWVQQQGGYEEAFHSDEEDDEG